MKVTEDKWIWMPHVGHFICGNDCRFHLNTKVGKYIVSTVGELWFDRQVREIHAKVFDSKWFTKNRELKGDDFDSAYMKRFGFEEIGLGRKFETMVFRAVKDKKNKCCPYTIVVSRDLDMDGYNSAEDAYRGHLKMCKKWANK